MNSKNYGDTLTPFQEGFNTFAAVPGGSPMQVTQSPIYASPQPLNAEIPAGASSYFNARNFAQVCADGAATKPRRQIVGKFLSEDTTSLFFSRTNYGKSQLAFQVAYAAATGTDFHPCSALRNECEPMPVLLADLELDERTLFDRHKLVMENPHPLITNLNFLHEKYENKLLIGFPLLQKIEEEAIRQKSKLIIIDNISKLLPDALKPDTATLLLTILNRIRKLTGATILILGHTKKDEPGTAIGQTSYYGSAMIQNFFNEIFYLDKTKNGKFFLRHTKSKQKDYFSDIVPVFTQGDHPVVGIGFTFEQLCPLADIQLPLSIMPEKFKRKIKIANFRHELTILAKNGITFIRMAEMFNVERRTVSNLLSNPSV